MSDNSNLERILESVCDEESFVTFLDALAADWDDEQQMEAVRPSSPYGPGANGWENGTIGAFLEAAGACARGHLRNPNPRPRHDNPWRHAAHILYCGKFYE